MKKQTSSKFKAFFICHSSSDPFLVDIVILHRGHSIPVHLTLSCTIPPHVLNDYSIELD